MSEEKERPKRPEQPPPLTKEEVAGITPLVCRALALASESAPVEIRGALIIASLDNNVSFLGMTHNQSPIRREIREEVHKRLHAWALGVLEEAGKEGGDGS